MRSFAKFSVLSWKLQYSRPHFAQGKPAFVGEPFDLFKDGEFRGGEHVELWPAPSTAPVPEQPPQASNKKYRCSLRHRVCQMEHWSVRMAVMMSTSAQKTTGVEVFP